MSKKIRIYVKVLLKGRCLFDLISFFHNMGYSVFLFDKDRLSKSFNNYGKYIYYLKDVKIINSLPKDTKDSIYVYDVPDENIKKDWKKIIEIDYDYFSKKKRSENCLIKPYPMHPILYVIYKHYKKVKIFRNRTKKRSIFFSGNVHPVIYSNKIIKKRFGLLSRIKIMNLLSKTKKAKILFIDSKEEFDSLKGFHNCVIILHGFRIRFKEWLKTIAESNFFLVLPGAYMPYCHNIVESIAVGTIPIIQNPNIFNPPLKHLKNCIIFKNKRDLLKKINYILGMDSLEVKNMRKRVIDYYEKYLLPSSFKKFESIKDKKIKLYVNTENRSVNLMKKKFKSHY